MSTASKVKRQVRRIAREVPKVRRRREMRARWQRAESRGLFTCSLAYWLTGNQMRRADADAIVLAFNSPGGPIADFMRAHGEAYANGIAEGIRVEYSLDTGRNYGAAISIGPAPRAVRPDESFPFEDYRRAWDAMGPRGES